MTPPITLPVLVPTPAHAAASAALSYSSECPLSPGTLVRVPLGARDTLGIVWDGAAQPMAPERLKPIAEVLDGIAPMGQPWRQLVDFAARYYQRSAGEVALAALPPALRALQGAQLARRLKRLDKAAAVARPMLPAAPVPSPEQARALEAIARDTGPFLLFGVTGSGKTEVYLRAAEQCLADADTQAQVLVMVPEINLTPQLEAAFRARFEPWLGPGAVVALHSALTPAQRLQSWLAAHTGRARVLLGTRLAVFASLPRLTLIVVDEEHDASYKQQEGARYSARDLAVMRARLESASGRPCRTVLGSATPSLESWRRSSPEDGGYQRLTMAARIGSGALPRVRVHDMRREPRGTVLAPALVQAMAERIARGEQSLLLLNRRGWAPVLHCPDCGWKSECPHCSAYRVFHRADRSLRCHHCGLGQPVPRACPACGNQDLAPIGRGTERLEELVAQRLTAALPPGHAAPRVLRIDADAARGKDALEQHLARVHGGEVDVIVGTQMVAKGHDFRRITLAAAVDPDGALFSADFRASERLFALLMQAAGRAGRDAARAGGSELWVQTQHPGHPLFAALARHDYPAYAATLLREREAAALPPFTYQALLRADARHLDAALAFLNAARDAALEQLSAVPGAAEVTLCSAVPLSMQRVAGVERAQLLAESPSRAALQRYLAAWQPLLHALRRSDAGKGLLRWLVDVDPLAI